MAGAVAASRGGRGAAPSSVRPAPFDARITRDTVDPTFAANRQLFLTEQGYRYTITDRV
jgi:hypothetical protein